MLMATNVEDNTTPTIDKQPPAAPLVDNTVPSQCDTKIALFPGSFDPITRGHEALVRRALPLFDQIVIAIGLNVRKQAMFPLEQRMAWIRDTFCDTDRVQVSVYHDLTVDFCRHIGARYILRGLRNETDFRYEAETSAINKRLMPELETLCLLSDNDLTVVSSSAVRELLRFGKDVSDYLPNAVKIQ